MGKESILGQMVKYMMENGLMGSSKDTVSGKVSMKTRTLDNGRIVKLMVMVCIYGRMVIIYHFMIHSQHMFR